MNSKMRRPAELDPGGFNEMSQCRAGPLLYNRNDIYIGGSLRRYGECSWAEDELFARIVRPGDLVVEAGANIGLHTVVLSKLAGPDGAVFAFEPQRIVFQALCANAALNQCTNVHAYQRALGATGGQLQVPLLDPAQSNNFGGLSLIGAEEGEAVPVQALDDWHLPACHFLKADVEGMEKDVLSGARRTIERHRPVMYLENDQPERSRGLIELVFGLGYDAYWHLPRLFNPHNFAGDPENLFPGVVSVNMLCIRAGEKSPLEGLRRVASPEDRGREGGADARHA